MSPRRAQEMVAQSGVEAGAGRGTHPTRYMRPNGTASGYPGTLSFVLPSSCTLSTSMSESADLSVGDQFTSRLRR